MKKRKFILSLSLFSIASMPICLAASCTNNAHNGETNRDKQRSDLLVDNNKVKYEVKNGILKSIVIKNDFDGTLNLNGVFEIDPNVNIESDKINKIVANDLTKIDANYFSKLSNLESFESDSVKEINDEAFKSSNNLATIKTKNLVNANLAAFRNTKWFENEFKKDSDTVELGKVLLLFKNKNKKSFKVNSNIVKIGDVAYGDGTLEEIDLNNVENVGARAFSGLKTLNNVIANNVKTVGAGAFSGTNIQSINLPKATEIKTEAFSNNRKLMFVNINNVKKIGNYAFHANQLLKNVKMDRVESIGKNAFEAAGLSSLNLTNVEFIDDEAFKDNQSLKSIYLPKNKYVGDSAFDRCFVLETLNIPKVEFIGLRGFADCCAIKTLDLPEVITIRDNAFLMNSETVKEKNLITSVNMPKVESIGAYAFSDKKLTSINIPKATKVGVGAFYNNAQLSRVEAPLLTDIGEFAFEYTPFINSLYVNGSSYAVFNDVLLSAQRSDLINKTEITIPENIKKISGSTFVGLEKLRKITLPNVEYIGADAFKGNTALETVIANKVKVIADAAFANCENLAELSFPELIQLGTNENTENYRGAFFRTLKLKSFIAPKLTIIKDESFQNSALSSFVASDVTEVGQRAFAFAENLTEINMPKLIKAGIGAFRDMVNVTKISTPLITVAPDYFAYNNQKMTEFVGSLSRVGTSAFSENTSLNKIDLSKIIEIDNNGFKNAAKLKVENANSLEIIRDFAFANNQSTETLNLAKLKMIGANAFENAKFKSVTLPNIETIGNSAFKNNELLKDLDIRHVIEIGENAFENDNQILTLELTNAKIIKRSAFKNASAINNVIAPKLETIENQSFSGLNKITSFDLPNLIIVGPYAFENNTSLQRITIPNVEQIKDYAFKNCANLANIENKKLNTIGINSFDDTAWFKDKNDKSENITLGKMLIKFNDVLKTNVILGENIKYIGNGAFENITTISSITSDYVIKIGDKAFANAFSGLESINMPNLESIGVKGFANNKKLKIIIAPKLKFVDRESFLNDDLQEINLPELKTVALYAFSNNSNLKKANLPKLEKVEQFGFENDIKLHDFNAPMLTANAVEFGGFHNTPQENNYIGDNN